MIRDLADFSDHHERTSDVLVIGAGVAGLLVATQLSKAGKQVIVAESGGLTQRAETHPLNTVEQLGAVYAGAEHGRFRCLGGTSTRWGGAMLPFQSTDLTLTRRGWEAEWPISLDALMRYKTEIERLFVLGDERYDYPEIMPGTFLARRAKWPAFRFRNVATVLHEDIRSQRGPEIWLNATATHFTFDPSGRFGRVRMQSENGAALSVTAAEIVIAAGAIESTRLLLLTDRQHDSRLFSADGVIGRYFYDHLSFPTATFTKVRRNELNRVIGFSFEGAVMRNLRFEPNAQLRASKNIPAGFVHIGFRTERSNGFDILREVYRKLQRRELPSPRDLFAILGSSNWLARAVLSRFVYKRLLFPDGALFLVHAVVEQEPRAENRIDLSPRHLDSFGLPLATVDWRVHDNDSSNVLAITNAFADAWSVGTLSHLADVELNLPKDLNRRLAEGGGIYHPGGSARMGTDVTRGVVDADLRTFRIPNLTVVSTATFPTGGGANPTMMLMMFALRAADRIALKLA